MNKEIENLANEIRSQLTKLESTFWDVFVAPSKPDMLESHYWKYERDDDETWLYYGTRSLFYKICLYLELKNANAYLDMFKRKFEGIIYDRNKTMKSHSGFYSDSEPFMIIHEEFREFLSAFTEFDYNFLHRTESNKLKQILENTNAIIDKTKTIIKNETSIYRPVKWFIEIVFPNTKSLFKARFIKKFTTYHPDILVPEISSAVEYKFVRRGANVSAYLDQIKTDADNYEGDSEYKFFYAVVFYEIKSEINPKAFKAAVEEKKFPENWEIIAL